MSAHHPATEIVFKKGAQIGGTEAANNLVGYVIDHAPGPLMMVLPTDTLAKRASSQRIEPMIRETPRLAQKVRPARERDSGNNLLSKEFPGGILILTGANSAVGLRSMPARTLVLDELDAYPRDIDEEGDPVELAIRRTATFGRKRKVVKISTPKIAGDSRICAAYENTDQRKFYIPCPFCGVFQLIEWGKLQQPGGEPWHRDSPPESVVMLCEACENEIPEHAKEDFLPRGEWKPTAQAPEDRVGFELSALYSPFGWYSWKQAAHDHLEAKGDREKIRTWTNTVLGEPFEEEATRLAWEFLFDRREDPAPTVAARCHVLTAGVDVQHNRLEVGVWGFNGKEEIWAIDHEKILGDPDQEAVWQELDEYLARRFQHETGATLGIPAACVDSGYATQRVYAYCQPRYVSRVYACKGKDGPGRPMVSAPTMQKMHNSLAKVRLYTLGVDQLKSWIYNRLQNQEPGPGFVHIPDREPFDEDWHRQLTAEECVTRHVRGYERRVWRLRKGRRRNEVLDCFVLARAALIRLNPDWDAIAENLEQQAGAGDELEEDRPKPKRRKKRTRWAERF